MNLNIPPVPEEQDPLRIAKEIGILAKTYTHKDPPAARALKTLVIDELQKLSPPSQVQVAKTLMQDFAFRDALVAWNPGEPESTESQLTPRQQETKNRFEAIQVIKNILSELSGEKNW